jgi:hypothetical protein
VLLHLGIRHAQGFLVAPLTHVLPRPSEEFEQHCHEALARCTCANFPAPKPWSMTERFVMPGGISSFS